MIPLSPLLAVPLPLALDLCTAFGLGLSPRPESNEALLADLLRHRIPRSLAAALCTLACFTTARARRDIVSAARASAFDLGRGAVREGPAELAARLLVASAKDAGVARLLRRALRHRERRPPAAPNLEFAERADAGAREPEASDEAIASLVADLRAWLEASGYEPIAEAHRAPEEGGFALEILRAGAVDAPLVWRGETKSALDQIPVVCDRLVFSSSRRRLRISTDDAELVAFYRKRAGARLFGDEHRFLARRTVSLHALQKNAAAVLDASRSAASIARVRLVRLVWDRGENDADILRGGDVLATIERRGLHPAVGRWLAATLRIDLAGRGHVDVHLKPPRRAHWDPSVHDAVVTAWLDGGELLQAGDAKQDLWMLSRATQSGTEWCADVGDREFEAWRASGVLRPSESRVVAHPTHEHAPRSILAFKDDDESWYGVAEDDDDDLPPVLLAGAALAGYKLDAHRLAETIAELVDPALPRAGKARAAVAEVLPGLFDLGARTLGDARVRLFIAASPVAREGLAERLRGIAGGAEVVVMVPAGRTLDAGVAEIALPSAGDDAREVAAAIARVLGDSSGVPVQLVAPEGTRLCIDVRAERAFLDGVELTKVGDQPLSLLVLLARADGAPVTVETINRTIARGRADDEGAKKIKARLVAGIGASFKAQKREPPADVGEIVVSTARGAYRLTVRAFVR